MADVLEFPKKSKNIHAYNKPGILDPKLARETHKASKRLRRYVNEFLEDFDISMIDDKDIRPTQVPIACIGIIDGLLKTIVATSEGLSIFCCSKCAKSAAKVNEIILLDLQKAVEKAIKDNKKFK